MSGAAGRKKYPTLIALVLLTLVACGGGGGSSGPQTPSGPVTTNNAIVATVSPPPPIRGYTGPNGVVVGPLIVVTFTTSDQQPASDLQVTATQPAMDLPTWVGPGTTFSCALVSTGNACTMTILYQVPTVGQGDLMISYRYKANNGASKTGVVHIAYVATQPSLALLAGWVGGPGFIDGIGTAARFSNPTAVAVDAAGAVYVADAGNFAVRKIAPGGMVTTLAVNGNFAYPFTSLTAAAVDQHGNVYVGDGNAIRMVNPAAGNNVPILLAGTGDGTGPLVPRSALLGDVTGLVVDTNGNIYASSSTNDVVKLEPDGSVIALAGTAGEFKGLGALTIDTAGTLYAIDAGVGVRAISPAGMVTTVAPVNPTGPAAGLSVDSTGALITSVALTNSIYKYTAANGFTKVAGDDLAGSVGGWADGGPGGSSIFSGGGGALFNAPTGVALEPSGNLIIADTGNSAIRQVTPAGIVSTLAGVGVLRGAVDGTGGSARFDISEGAGVAADAAGNVFITDTGNGGIRKVTPAGAVTTVPGAGGCLNGGVAVDQAGNLYVTVCLGTVQDPWRPSAIQKITPQGVVTLLTDTAGKTLESGNLETWTALAVDARGSLYVIDGNEILKITSDGVRSTWAGSGAGAKDGTGTAAMFAGPSGIAFAPSGDLYVADTGNHTIRRITPDAVVTTFAGQTGMAGECGSGFELLSSPRSLTVDFAGAIYVVNSGTNSICRVTPDHQVYNLLGGPRIGTVLGTLPTTIDPPQGIVARPDGQIAFTVDSAVLVTAGL